MKRPVSALIVSDADVAVPATEFKARCLAIMQAIHERRSPAVVVTKHGKPLVRISATGARTGVIGGWWKKPVTITGDLSMPTGEVWNAESRT